MAFVATLATGELLFAAFGGLLEDRVMAAIIYPGVWVAPAVLTAAVARAMHRAEGLWWTMATAAAVFLVMTGAFRASTVALGAQPHVLSMLGGSSTGSPALVLVPLLALAGMSALVLASTLVQVNDLWRLLSGYEQAIRVTYAQRVALTGIALGLTVTAVAVVSGACIAYLRAGSARRIWRSR